jgi:hypothetical protein
MLAPATSSPLATSEVGESRDQRRQRLHQQLLAQALPLLTQMTDTLVDAPDDQWFRAVEVRLRDLGQQVAAAAQQTGLEDRKKRAT